MIGKEAAVVIVMVLHACSETQCWHWHWQRSMERLEGQHVGVMIPYRELCVMGSAQVIVWTLDAILMQAEEMGRQQRHGQMMAKQEETHGEIRRHKRILSVLPEMRNV